MMRSQGTAGVFDDFLSNSGQTLTIDRWHDFWWIPAIFAAVVMIIFIIFFDDKVIEDKEDVEASDFTV